MKRVATTPYWVELFIAGGDPAHLAGLCQDFCNEVGLCVTINETAYVYTGGAEAGLTIGLINYGRFPSEPDALFTTAEALAVRLIEGSDAESATLLAPDRSLWLSDRPEGTGEAA